MRIEAAPGGHELSLFGLSLIEQDDELLGLQRMEKRVRRARPPAQTAAREAPGEEPEPYAVIGQQF